MDLTKCKRYLVGNWILLLVLAIAGSGAVLALLLFRGEVGEFLQWIWVELEGRPVLLYLLIVIVPAFPIPQSPLLVLAGMVFGSRFGVIPGSALAASALGINILWCYFLCSGPLRGVAQWFLQKLGYRLPVLPAGKAMAFSFLIRVTPVIPLSAQNYILGLLNVPLGTYLVASWSTQMPIAFAIALTGGAILEGNVIWIVAAITIFLLVTFLLRQMRSRLRESDMLEDKDNFI